MYGARVQRCVRIRETRPQRLKPYWFAARAAGLKSCPDKTCQKSREARPASAERASSQVLVVCANSKIPAARLVRRDAQLEIIRRFKSPLLIPVMQQNHRRHMNRVLALPANRRFALQVLHESIREVVSRSRTPRRLIPRRPTIRANEFDAIFQRIAVESRPSGIAKSHCFLGCLFHGCHPKSHL